MSHSVASQKSSLSHYTSRTSRTSASNISNFQDELNAPKLCKCYALEPGESCSGIPFGLDLMSKKKIKRLGTARRNEKFQMNLISHSQRFGWGIPMKPNQNPGGGHLDSTSPAKKKKKKRGGGKQKDPPIMHRASSAEKYIHPSHGTLESSAKVLLPPMIGEGKVESGAPWWENQMSQQPKTPGTASAVVASTLEPPGFDPPQPQMIEDGEVVDFNNLAPLPGIGMEDPDLTRATSADLLIRDNAYEENLKGGSADEKKAGGINDDDQTQTSDITQEGFGVMQAFENMERSQDPVPVESIVATPHGDNATTASIANDASMKDFRLDQMVDAALFASWKALPWQSRVCPRALEERESVRLLASMVQEARRVRAWRQQQQQAARDAAMKEDRRFAKWALEERKRVSEFEEKEAARVAEEEAKLKEIVLNNEHRERTLVNQEIESEQRKLVFFQMCEEYHLVAGSIITTYRQCVERDPLDAHVIDRDDLRLRLLKEEEERFSESTRKQEIKAAWQASSEKARALDSYNHERSRVDDCRLKSHYVKSANAAAHLAATKTICNDEDGNAFQFWTDEVSRVNVADEEETNRLKAWETLQLAVMRSAGQNVIRLLHPDPGGVDADDELDRCKWYAKAYKQRSREEKNKFTKQRYLARKQADAVSRAWKSALDKWREASSDLHEKRREQERERVERNTMEENKRVEEAERKEADRVSYSWKRECDRVTRWRGEEANHVSEMLTEWRRGGVEWEKAFLSMCRKSCEECEGIKRKWQEAESESDWCSKEKKTIETEWAEEAEKAAMEETRERETVLEWESAFLLWSMGVDEKIMRMVKDSYYESVKKRQVEDREFDERKILDEFRASEIARVEEKFAAEKDRVVKAHKLSMELLEDAIKSGDDGAANRYEAEKTRVEDFAKSCVVYVEQIESEMLENAAKWGAAQENVVVNECLRIFGVDCLTRSKTLPEIPREDEAANQEQAAITEEEEEEGNAAEVAGEVGAEQDKDAEEEFDVLEEFVEDGPVPVAEEAIGKVIKVYWEDEDEWFQGKVDKYVEYDDIEHFDGGDFGFHVIYDDGDEEWIDERDEADFSRKFRFPSTITKRIPKKQEAAEMKTAEEDASTPTASNAKSKRFSNIVKKNNQKMKKSKDGTINNLRTMSQMFGNIIEPQLLHSWRVKCTVELMKHRLAVMNEEIKRQGRVGNKISNECFENVKSTLEEERGLIVSWIDQRNITERMSRSERADNEKRRIEVKSEMDLKSWEIFSSLVLKFHEMTFKHGKLLLENWTRVFASVVDDGDDTNNDGDDSELTQKHLSKMNVILNEDKVVGQNVVEIDRRNWESIVGGYVNEISSMVSGLSDKNREEERLYSDEKVAEEDKQFAVVKKCKEELNETFRSALASIDEVDGVVREIEVEENKVDYETCTGEVAEKCENLLRKVNSIKVSIDEVLASFPAKVKSAVGNSAQKRDGMRNILSLKLQTLEGEVAGKRSSLSTKLSGVHMKCIAELEKAVEDSKEKDAGRVRAFELNMTDQLSVLMREFDHDIDLLKQDQTAVVERGKAEKEGFVKAEVDAMEIFMNEEIKGSIEKNPGNSNVEEQMKCVDKVLDNRKEKLKELIEEAVRVENDEVIRESGEMVAVRTSHEAELNRLWKEYSKTYGENRKVVDTENAGVLENHKENLKAEMDSRLEKEISVRNDWLKWEMSEEGMLKAVAEEVTGLESFGQKNMELLKTKAQEANSVMNGESCVLKIHRLRDNVLNAIKEREEHQERERKMREEREQQQLRAEGGGGGGQGMDDV